MKMPKNERAETEDNVFYSGAGKGLQSILCLDKRDDGTGCIFVSDMSDEELIRMLMDGEVDES